MQESPSEAEGLVTCSICLEPMHPMPSPRAGRVQHAQSDWQPRHLLQDPRSPRNRHSSESPLLREMQQRCTALETLGCGHTFHRQCIVPWIQYKRTCPICKGPAELVAPGVADNLMLGTSFQKAFTPQTSTHWVSGSSPTPSRHRLCAHC